MHFGNLDAKNLGKRNVSNECLSSFSNNGKYLHSPKYIIYVLSCKHCKY